MKVLQRCVAALLVAAVLPASAGSPGGLKIVVIGAAKTAAYAEQVKTYFAMSHSDPMSCLDSTLNLNSGYSESTPKGMTADLALGAVSDKKKRRQLGKLMSAYRDSAHPRGFDGALAYDLKDGKLALHGVSALADAEVATSWIALADVKDKSKFNLAMCKALVNLPVMEAP